MAEVGKAEVGIEEFGTSEVGIAEGGTGEGGIAEVGSEEDGIGEVGMTEVGSAEIRPYLWMLLSPCIPGDCTLFEYIEVLLTWHVGSPMNTCHYRD